MARNVFDELRDTLDTISDRLGETGSEIESEVSDIFGRVSVDVSEDDDAYTVTADLPGFDRDDIEVNIRDDTLHLRAHHESERESEDERFLRRERARQSVSRTVRMPGGIESDAAEASFNNGVLTVRLPKTDQGVGRRVEIS